MANILIHGECSLLCENCNKLHRVDAKAFPTPESVSSCERNMGAEVCHAAVYCLECSCGNTIKVRLEVWEYPEGELKAVELQVDGATVEKNLMSASIDMSDEIAPWDDYDGGQIPSFEDIKFLDENGTEYWLARGLSRLIGYDDYRNFEKVIRKAQKSCEGSNHKVWDHFVEVTEMIPLPKGAQRDVKSYALSRYACYLIIQNADPHKEMVALGQTYFAIQTRRQELQVLSQEEERRLMLREEMKTHNKKLAGAASNAGVIEPKDYAIFQNHGYQGLYGGLTMQHIHQRKGLKKSQKILDHMGSTELAANLFRATQTEEKLRRENITGKDKANRAHREVGVKVRKTIKDLGGTMPENLPIERSIKKLETKKRKVLKKQVEDSQ